MSEAALNMAAKISMILCGLGVLALVARLGPEVQGAFSLFAAAEAAVLALGSGAGLWLARRVSTFQAQAQDELPQALWVAAGAGLGAGVVLVGVAMRSDAPPFSVLWMLALAAPCLLMSNAVTGLWLGQGRMAAMNFPLVMAPLAVLVVLGGAVVAGAALSVSQVLALWLLAKTGVALMTLGWALRAVAWRGFSLSVLRWRPPPGMGRFLVVIALTNGVTLANYRVALFLVEHALGLAAVGVYSVALQVAELLWLFSSSVTLAAYGRIGAASAADAAQTAWQIVRFNLAMVALAAPLLWGLCAWLVPAVLGPVYAEALGPLAVLLPGVVAYAAGSGLSAYFTNHLGRPQWSGRLAGLSLTLNALGGWWLIPLYGLWGAALAQSVAYGITMAVALGSFWRESGLGHRGASDEKPKEQP